MSLNVTRTDQATAPGAQPARAAAAQAAPKTSVAHLLATSSSATRPASAASAASAAATSASRSETTRKVPGQDYVEVTSGPRNGMFINISDNDRRGQAFVRVQREDRELHIYGSGKDRHVVTVMHDRKAVETTRKVEGHDTYVEITSGPRNGMFLNTSHNERHGQAFVLVEKGDYDLHIYGSGKDRRVIRVSQRPADGDGSPAAKQTDTAASTGGVKAP